MSDFRFAHITDLHLSDTDFPNHVPGQQEELWRMLDEVADICIDERLDVLFVTGDIFDRKSPRLNSHALVRRLMQYFTRLSDHGVETIAIAGNHDLSSGGMETFGRQPLGVLAESGAVFMPLGPVNRLVDDISIRITPLHFEDRAEFDPEFYHVGPALDSRYHIVLAHGSLSSKRHRYNFPHIPYEDVPNDGIDLLLWGHIHEDHGIEEVNGTTFVNCGSFCRRARDQQRDVYIAVGSIDASHGIRVEKRKLETASPWQDIFNDAVQDYSPVADPTLVGIARDARDLFSFEVVDFPKLVNSADIPKGVKDRAIAYLEAAQR